MFKTLKSYITLLNHCKYRYARNIFKIKRYVIDIFFLLINAAGGYRLG